MVIIFRNGQPIELTEAEIYDVYRAYRIRRDYAALKEQCKKDRKLVEQCDAGADELIYDALKILDASSYPEDVQSDVETALFSSMVIHGLLRGKGTC